jgi:hypothetical protein
MKKKPEFIRLQTLVANTLVASPSPLTAAVVKVMALVMTEDEALRDSDTKPLLTAAALAGVRIERYAEEQDELLQIYYANRASRKQGHAVRSAAEAAAALEKINGMKK